MGYLCGGVLLFLLHDASFATVKTTFVTGTGFSCLGKLTTIQMVDACVILLICQLVSPDRCYVSPSVRPLVQFSIGLPPVDPSVLAFDGVTVESVKLLEIK